MLFRAPRSFIAVVSLLAFLFAGQTGVLGKVICVGEDGDVELEYSINDLCVSPSGETDCAALGQEIHALASDDGCGTCLDIPTSRDFRAVRHQFKKSFSPLAVSPPVWEGAPQVAAIGRDASHVLSPGPLRVSQSILSHRTVVLLN
ncbi:MAG: hypothetical protein C0616_00985 [Desulfuromonas sp.]|mgnify:CR=1 FL=1|nr:MAG: hypothetical protein C0616_00985 [Desulfuromonas sp.]